MFNKSELLSPEQLEFIKYFQDHNLISMEINDIKETELPHHISDILNVVLENSLYQLFPYAQKGYDSKKTLIEIEDSLKNLNTRLLNLKKINKSLNEFEENNSNLSWDELKKISFDIQVGEET